MPYKLDCSIGKIISPIVLIFPDGNKQDYLTGNDAIKIIYEKRYDVKSMKVVSDKVEILLSENDGYPKGLPDLFDSGL